MALPQCPRVLAELSISAKDLSDALAILPIGQLLYQDTRAVHAAGIGHKRRGLIALAEDVGRHNALDKLISGVRRSTSDVSDCILLLTSRVSGNGAEGCACRHTCYRSCFGAYSPCIQKTAGKVGITLITVAHPTALKSSPADAVSSKQLLSTCSVTAKTSIRSSGRRSRPFSTRPNLPSSCIIAQAPAVLRGISIASASRRERAISSPSLYGQPQTITPSGKPLVLSPVGIVQIGPPSAVIGMI